MRAPLLQSCGLGGPRIAISSRTLARTENIATPSRADFAALSKASSNNAPAEGSVRHDRRLKTISPSSMSGSKPSRVPLKEFGIAGKPADLKVGDEVEVFLERIENALGEAVLSRDKARREESWNRLEKQFEAGEKVQGVIFNKVKGGFTVDLDGAVAFLPRSQVDIRPIRDVTPLMNVPQQFQILKMDRRRGNIVVSRRTVLEETRAEQRQELVQNLEEGQVIDGVVKNITDYGAFVDLGGIDGLLHVTECLAARQSPHRVLNIGRR
jgi:small subunit ribosomal protein S1